MNDKSLVSIIIPSFNHQAYIGQAINSVIAQTYQNIELIVIDDGSSDESLSVIHRLEDRCRKRFRRFTLITRENKGLSATLNEGLEWCKGEYVACLASDDMLYPNKTAVEIEHLRRSESAVAVFSGITVLHDNSGYKRSIVKSVASYTFKDILFHKHHLPAPTQMLRMSAVRMTGGFSEDTPIEDWDMWLKLTKDGARIDYIKETLAVYRIHGTNTSRNAAKMADARRKIIKKYRVDKLLYMEALSRVELVNACDFAASRNTEWMPCLCRAVALKPLIMLSWTFLRSLTICVKYSFVSTK